MTMPDMANAANNLLPSFMEIGIGGLIIVAARKWGLREAYVMIAIGVLGTLICVGMILSSGKSIAAMTIVQVAVVTGMLVVWAHIFYGTWRDARVTGLANPMTSASAGQQRPEAKKIQVGMIPVVSDWTSPQPLAPSQPVHLVDAKDIIVYAPRGETRARGIAIVRGVIIEAIRDKPTNDPVFQCRCAVALHGLDPTATASPSQLKITGSGDRDELVTLKAIVPAKAIGPGALVPGISLYGGLIYPYQLSRLIQAVKRQMGENFQFSLPPSEPAYCQVEVRLPDGEALERHRQSGIKMDFELHNEQKKDFLIQIPSGVSIGPLLL